jgi:hypothetical protein
LQHHDLNLRHRSSNRATMSNFSQPASSYPAKK